MARWNADPNTRCCFCNQRARVGDPWEPNHRLPHVDGGADHPSNLEPSHRSCNRADGARIAKRRRKERADAQAAERMRATLQLIEGRR